MALIGTITAPNTAKAAPDLVGASLFADSTLTTPGLVGSYVNSSLQGVTNADDWVTTQIIAGTRIDTNLSFTTATWGARAGVGITGGSDADWDSFSVQWDGFLQVTQAGQRFATASDDGSRMWIDLDHDDVFEAGELLDNGWGRGQGVTGGDRSIGLSVGTYRIRIQYYEISGNNEFHLATSAFVPRQFVASADNPRQTIKAIVLSFDPRVPSEGGRRLHEVFGWGDPHRLAQQFERDLEFATGGAIDIQVVEFRDLDDFPDQVDGYRPTPDGWVNAWRSSGPWHRQATDFERLVEKQGLVALVNSGAVDEIWCFGPPAEIDLFGETWMAGPNAFYINGSTFPGIPFDRAIAGYGFNYERGVDCMLHNLGHRTEDSMARPYGGWQLQPPVTPWDNYAANALESPGHTAGVGTCEVPANAAGHYDYGNTSVVQSSAFDWSNFPNLTGTVTPVSSFTWCFGPAPDSQRDYFNWFWGMMPRNAGTNSDGRQANWFKYIWDFNSYQAGSGLFRQREAIASMPRFIIGSNLGFSVRYYDARGVNQSTLGDGDVRVTGPNAYDRLATLSQVVAGTDPRHLTAFYAIPAPAGTWRDADQGDYEVRLESNQVLDATGVAFPSGSMATAQLLRFEASAIKVRRLVAANKAIVACTPPDMGSVDHLFDQDLGTLYRTSSENPAQVQVTFTESQTLRGFRFYGAGSATPPAYLLNIETADTQADLTARSGTYRQLYEAAPANNRQVTQFFPPAPVVARIVRLSATQVMGDGVIHLYDWTLLGPVTADTTAPTASLTATNVTDAGGAGSSLNVTYSDPSLIDAASLGTGDLLVRGPNGISQLPIFTGVDDWHDGPTRSVGYWCPGPGGVWDSSDNGTYTVMLQAAQVYDAAGNSLAYAQSLGSFSVDIAPPVRRPACDLAESNAMLWLAGADGSSASTSNDLARKVLGTASVLFMTDGGYDTWLRFPPAEHADWDLTGANHLYFSIYAENSNDWGFQENSPWVRMRDANGGWFDYRFYQNGYRTDPLNTALNQWRQFLVPLRASDSVANGWRRTVSGVPRLDHIASIEFHADTWGAGFRLWYDRIGFDLPVRVLESRFEVIAGVPHLRLSFDQSVQASLTTDDLQLLNTNTNVPVPVSALSLAYDPGTNVAQILFPGLPVGILPDGNYRLTIAANAISDPAGNTMAADFVFGFEVLDGDGDGMPDVWERDNHLNPIDASDAAADADGDGQSNLAEYLAGTNPRDASSVLRIGDIARQSAAAGGGFAIAWASVANRLYNLERSYDLMNWAVIGRNVQATPPVNTVADTTVAPFGQAFYRLIVLESADVYSYAPLARPIAFQAERKEAEGAIIAQVSWDSLAGMTYAVERSADLASWLVIAENLAATAPRNTYTDRAPVSQTKAFYRVLER